MAMLCTQFRTYNPSSRTYRGYDGQTHSLPIGRGRGDG